ncbi:hypothetical protein [Nioella nitratireducens]|uniref:hypothetical protein n=1 Tax=Nioella nitratireducens TaxID=1287720 RepID=UPI0008FD74BD|nr:hypothetical protein [Nioella nitratireducens]
MTSDDCTFWHGESGATTVDWVVLSAAVTGLGIAAMATTIAGLGSLSGETRDAMTGISVGAGFGGGPLNAEDTAIAVGLVNGHLDSDQLAGTWSLGTVDGWSNAGSGGQIETWGNGFHGMETGDGSSFVELDATSNGIDHISTLIDMEDGVAYELSFASAARAGGSSGDSFEVVVNGDVVATISPQSTTSFEQSSVVIYGQSGDDRIGFREIADQNNSLGILLDSVEISQM